MRSATKTPPATEETLADLTTRLAEAEQAVATAETELAGATAAEGGIAKMETAAALGEITSDEADAAISAIRNQRQEAEEAVARGCCVVAGIRVRIRDVTQALQRAQEAKAAAACVELFDVRARASAAFAATPGAPALAELAAAREAAAAAERELHDLLGDQPLPELADEPDWPPEAPDVAAALAAGPLQPRRKAAEAVADMKRVMARQQAEIRDWAMTRTTFGELAQITDPELRTEAEAALRKRRREQLDRIAGERAERLSWHQLAPKSARS